MPCPSPYTPMGARVSVSSRGAPCSHRAGTKPGSHRQGKDEKPWQNQERPLFRHREERVGTLMGSESAWTKELTHQIEQLPARTPSDTVKCPSAQVSLSARRPGPEPCFLRPQGLLLSLDGAAHPGCHSRHTPWILDPHCGRTRQTRGTTHPSGQGFTSHCTKYTHLTARRTHRQTWLRQGPEEPASPPPRCPQAPPL